MTRDFKQFPDDDNGNVLWQMQQDGDDLSVPHEIEYSIAFSTQEQAEQCALYLLKEEPLYTTNFIGSLSYQAFSFLKLLALS